MKSIRTKLQRNPEKAAIQLIRRIREDPVFFVREIVGDRVYPHQERVLRGLAARTAVKGAHGTGKDHMTAWVVWWFRLAYSPANVYVTGPSEPQVEDVIWQNIKRVWAKCETRGYPLGGKWKHLYHESEGGHSFMRAFVAKQPENIQGRHAPNQLIVYDESSGIPRSVFDAGQSLLTADNNWAFAIGNPIWDPGGWFPSIFTQSRKSWKCHTFDGYEVANYNISGGITWNWIHEIEEMYGKESQVVLARVRGEFPIESSDTLIALAWIERAMERVRDMDSVRSLGADIARFGSDDTVITVNLGYKKLLQFPFNGQDTMRTCGEIIKIGKEHGISDRSWRIDDTGVGGGVTDRLRELGYRLQPVVGAAKPMDEDKFLNARAEGYWNMREMLREGRTALPADNLLLRDLSSIKYKFDSQARIKIEPKDEMKKRLGFSPDRADSMMLALLPDAFAGIYSGKGNIGLFDYYDKKAKELGIQDITTVFGVETIPKALESLPRFQRIECVKEEWPKVREFVEKYANEHIAKNDHNVANFALMEIRRLDETFGYRPWRSGANTRSMSSFLGR